MKAMNTIRSIKIVTGIKRIELNGDEFTNLFKIQEVLKEHRNILVDRLIPDLTNYIKYKFSVPASKEQQEQIRAKLYDLRNSSLSVSNYGDLINQILANESIYVRSELFYQEIDAIIDEKIDASQLILR